MPRPVPGWMQDPDFVAGVSAGAFQTLCLLWWTADGDGNVALSSRDLAERCGVRRERMTGRLREALCVRWHGRPLLVREGRRMRWLSQEVQPVEQVCWDWDSGADGRCEAPAEAVSASSAVRAPRNPAIRRLLDRHRTLYREKTGADAVVVWGRDAKLYQQLLNTYDPETLERLQDAYFAQSLDSGAGRRGYPVPVFFAESAGLAAREAQRTRLTPEQDQRRAALEALGCPPESALALVVEVPGDQIDRQLAAWPRRTGIRRPATALPQAVREDWPMPSGTRDDGATWAPLAAGRCDGDLGLARIPDQHGDPGSRTVADALSRWATPSEEATDESR